MWNENAALLNPAATGVMDEDLRFLSNFRMQWMSINGDPMRTNTFLFDAKILKNKTNGSHMGIGVNFTNDQTGDVRLTSNVVGIPIAYSIAMDKRSFLTIALSPGFYSQSIGNGNQTWDNQWTGSEFDQSINSGEVYQITTSAFDLGAGIQYYNKFDGNANFKIGLGVNHVTAPKLTYTNLNTNLFRNINITVSGNKFIPERKFGISPQLLVSIWGPNSNVVVGSYFDYELFESSKRTDYVQRSFISVGGFYRFKDALIASISYKYNAFKVGFSYDLNLSTLTPATRSMGGIEFFLKFSMMADRSNYIHDRRLFRWRGGKGRM